ncbi:hypothetical protein P3102_29185 [Amycolatopsis sp. QT-25]|uniref:hypothetical protein n=1 Tax=Amycolatopsis sp. QT-25 TaxID=3034022 RepID=UPI0023ED6CCB|nr:hypothetical protein [Amycolatopsis sp. QT-25]WET78109.1 hypothetical protein P3102_29185 [Amycolatopsis sp. QT-25]
MNKLHAAHVEVHVRDDVDPEHPKTVELGAEGRRATAKIIRKNACRLLGLVSGADQTTMDGKEVEEMRPQNTKPHVIEAENVGPEGAPSGTRTPNPLVKSRHLGVSDGVE